MPLHTQLKHDNIALPLHRYGLVRVRENAESIAFYGGEVQERGLLARRLARVVENNGSLIVTSRNLEFFTSFYRPAPARSCAPQLPST